MNTLSEIGETPTLTTIARRSVKEMIVEQIRLAILRGELRPGERVTEPSLAKKLGVGQATIREALIELEHMGFIQRVKPRKTFVTKLSSEEIDQMYALRVPLELLVLEMIVAANIRDFPEARNAHAGMCAALTTKNIDQLQTMDLEFHRALWRVTKNPFVIDTLERLVGKLFAFALVIMSQEHESGEYLRALVDKHGKILDRLQAGDLDEAKKLLAETMDRTWIRREKEIG